MRLSYSHSAYLHPNVSLDRSIHFQLSGLNLLNFAARFLASPVLQRIMTLSPLRPRRELRGNVREILPV